MSFYCQGGRWEMLKGYLALGLKFEKIGGGAKTIKNPYIKGFFKLLRTKSKEKFTLFYYLIESDFQSLQDQKRAKKSQHIKKSLLYI